MAFKRQQTFYRSIDGNGEPQVSDQPPEDGEGATESIEAGSSLAAHRLLFGTLPDVDPGILDLVVLLNELPGVMTWTSCEGHTSAGDACACVSLTFENLTAIEQFADLVSFVTSDEAYMCEENPPVLGLCLELDLGAKFEEGGPICCELLLGRFPMDRAKRGRPPGAKALRQFALQLRERAAARFPDAVTAPHAAPPVSNRNPLREASR